MSIFGSGQRSHLPEPEPDAARGAILNPLPASPRPSCSCKKFGKEPVTQKLYRCKTCKMSSCAVICPGCAAFCHSGHEVVSIGTTYGTCACGAGCSHCYCFLMNPVDGDENFEHGEYRQCRYLFTGKNYENGPIYQCHECGQDGGTVACTACQKLCHKDHDCHFRRVGRYFCDCGAEPDRWHCKIIPKKNESDEVRHCTRFITDVNPSLASDMTGVLCATCGVFVCDSCKNQCHSGHHFVASKHGVCQCAPDKCVDRKNKEPAA